MVSGASYIACFQLISRMLMQYIHQPCPVLDRPSRLCSCGCQHHGVLPFSLMTLQCLGVQSHLCRYTTLSHSGCLAELMHKQVSRQVAVHDLQLRKGCAELAIKVDTRSQGA